jgi:intron-binding protein aquarius
VRNPFAALDTLTHDSFRTYKEKMEDIKQEGSSRAHNGASAAHATDSSSLHARPTVADLHGDSHFAQVARKHWLTAQKSPKVRPEVVKKELWDELEKVDFAYPSLLVLENLQLLERYLWPGFTEDASNYHHLLLALMVNVKRRENLPSWGKTMRRCVPCSGSRC